MTDEKRRFTRTPFKVRAEIETSDARYCAAEISNLSIGGCLLPIQADLEPGTVCRMKIILEGTGDVCIRVEGKVVRSPPETVALQFHRIDRDSLLHLQNVIRYNAPDANAVDMEILKHPGLV